LINNNQGPGSPAGHWSPQSWWGGGRRVSGTSKWCYVKLIDLGPSDQKRRGSTGEICNCKWKVTEVRRSGPCFTRPHFSPPTCDSDSSPALRGVKNESFCEMRKSLQTVDPGSWSLLSPLTVLENRPEVFLCCLPPRNNRRLLAARAKRT